MDLQQKVMDAFIGKVVRKDLAFLVKGGLASAYLCIGISAWTILCQQ
jgi:predicted ATP-dependent Lon-type protease